MKKFIRLIYLFLLPLAVTFSACEDEEESFPEGSYRNGVLVINEGLYLSGNGSISFISQDSLEITNDLFDRVNDIALGSNIQSIGVHGDKLLVLANSANKVEILNGNDLKQLQAPLSGNDFNVPRYFTSIGNTGYISCWGPYNSTYGLDDSYIAVLNLETMSLVKKIPATAGPEGIVAVDNKIFVANSFSNTVSVIVNNEITDTIEVIAGPEQLIVDKNKDVWVFSTGGFVTTGGIVRLNSSDYSVEKTYITTESSPSGIAAINGTKDKLYYITGASYLNNTNVFALNLDDTELPVAPLISGTTFYGLGIDPSDGTIYVADAPNFTTSGKVFRYKPTGEKIDEYTAGIAPNGFVFR